jgi:hypothetical protein
MGGLVIETVRPGVQFVPDAAQAFRRADAQVCSELGRPIDVNSTYRAWDLQMRWHLESLAYVNGTGPYPGHSWATHPTESFHVAGTALDSDDWVNARIVAILADHGFIRNRLYVKGEQHHFEWLRQHDNHYGEPIVPPKAEDKGDDDMKIIRDPGTGEQRFVDELGSDLITDFFFTGPGRPDWVTNINGAWTLAGEPEDATGWEYALARHMADARWGRKRAEIVTDTVNSLKPFFQALGEAVAGIDSEVVERLIEEGLANVCTPPEVDPGKALTP